MRISKLLPIIGLLLFAWTILRSQPLEIINIFLGINPFYFFLNILMIGTILAMKGFKWRLVIRMHGLDYSLRDCIRVWSIGMFAGIITPGRTGDAIRSFYLKQKGGRFGRCFSTVVIDRMTDLIVVLLFASLGILMFAFWFISPLSLILLTSFIASCLIALRIMIKKRFAVRLLRPIFNFFVPKKQKAVIRVSFHDFYESVEKIGKEKTKIIFISALTTFIWLFSILEIHVIGLALGLSIDYLYLLGVMSLVVIIELIPISVSGIGTRDTFLVFSFGLIGISIESSIAFSILYLISYWIMSAPGIIFWIKDPIKLNM